MKCVILSCLGILCKWLYMKRKSDKYFLIKAHNRGPTVPLNLVYIVYHLVYIYSKNDNFHTVISALTSAYRKQCSAFENVI